MPSKGNPDREAWAPAGRLTTFTIWPKAGAGLEVFTLRSLEPGEGAFLFHRSRDRCWGSTKYVYFNRHPGTDI